MDFTIFSHSVVTQLPKVFIQLVAVVIFLVVGEFLFENFNLEEFGDKRLESGDGHGEDKFLFDFLALVFLVEADDVDGG